jgi:arginyl-tRNA synthetase
MKERLTQVLQNSLSACHKDGLISVPNIPSLILEIPKDKGHGDFATNIAMVLASEEKKPPRAVAGLIVNNIQDPGGIIERVEIAGPGFINFFIKADRWYDCLREIGERKDSYGKKNLRAGKRVQVEFVSANPTGPLHIGHGRGAVTGDTLANILEAVGYDVSREYYINDTGTQINTLGKSVFIRYQQLFGKKIELASEYYQGEYIKELAREIKGEHGDAYLYEDEEKAIPFFSSFASRRILEDIKSDLVSFGITFDNWFSEKELFEKEKVRGAIEDFKDKGYIYQKDGAFWFKSSMFGDDKDRVIIKADGEMTYFASDIAYHKDKYERGFDWVVDIWGADHHGYIPRMEAVIQAMEKPRDVLKILLVQLVNLLRGGKPIAMSTREGKFTTLREVIDEVGRDAARYFLLLRRSDSHLDFDLELAKQKSEDNPVYYVHYAHARICGIIREAKKRKLRIPGFEEIDAHLLSLPEELELIKQLSNFPGVVEGSAKTLEPHRVTFFLNDLASNFHSYYNRNRVIFPESMPLTHSRLCLVMAIKVVLKNGLSLLGVSAPESM